MDQVIEVGLSLATSGDFHMATDNGNALVEGMGPAIPGTDYALCVNDNDGYSRLFHRASQPAEVLNDEVNFVIADLIATDEGRAELTALGVHDNDLDGLRENVKIQGQGEGSTPDAVAIVVALAPALNYIAAKFTDYLLEMLRRRFGDDVLEDEDDAPR